MKISVPFSFNDYVMGYGRTYGTIKSIAGEITEDGVKRLRFSNIEGRSALDDADSYREFKNLTQADYKEITLNPPYSLGETVIYKDDNQRRLAEGKITRIQFNVSQGYSIFWYYIGSTQIDRFNIYKSREDFAKRTAPKSELREGEKYAFTKYCIQQNTLVTVFITEKGDVKSKGEVRYQYNRGSAEQYRNKNLFNSVESFLNDMFEEINRK